MLRMGKGSKPELPEHQRDEQTPPASVPQTASAGYATDAETPAAVVANNQFSERPAAATAPRATTDHENLARAIKDGVVGGFVGNTTALTGEANFKGMLRVDGRLSGRVTSEKGTLLVSSGGQVDAEINVAVAKINGTVNGNINTSERLELGRTARVVGNIQTPELIIEQGAFFEGGCRMLPRTAAVQPSPPAAARQPPLMQPKAQIETADASGAQPTPVAQVGSVAGNGQSARPNVTA